SDSARRSPTRPASTWNMTADGPAGGAAGPVADGVPIGGESAGGPVLPRPESDVRDEEWMRAAIAAARRTPPGDVPVGAIVVGPDGTVVAEASNRREADADPIAHAEVLAIRAAARAHGDGWRLEDCTLVVTLEPCVMCAGAAVMA